MIASLSDRPSRPNGGERRPRTDYAQGAPNFSENRKIEITLELSKSECDFEIDEKKMDGVMTSLTNNLL